MSLELKVSADDVKSLFTKDRELLVAAFRHKDHSSGDKYSPNLYITPLIDAGNLIQRSVPDYLAGKIGLDKDTYWSRIMAAAANWRSLVASLDDEQATDDLDTLIGQHISQLKWFEGLYTQLSGLNAAEFPNDDVAESIDQGLNGFRTLITRLNTVYNPKTRAEFLQQVHEGVVEKDYEQRLLQ